VALAILAHSTEEKQFRSVGGAFPCLRQNAIQSGELVGVEISNVVMTLRRCMRKRRRH
jgi:hypothetical protein